MKWTDHIYEPSSYFVAVGILDFCDTTAPNYEGSKILIRNRLNDGSDTDEWWRDKREQHCGDVAARNVALSSVIGISCDGIVIRLPDTIVDAIVNSGVMQKSVWKYLMTCYYHCKWGKSG